MSTRLPSVELPPEDGEFSFFLNYNGEAAFAIKIENTPGDLTGKDPTNHVVAVMKVTPMPIEGWFDPGAEITLYLRGSSETPCPPNALE